MQVTRVVRILGGWSSLRREHSRQTRPQRGQAFFEFAWLGSVFLIPFLVLTLDFAQIFWYDVLISAAADAGARAAANGAPNADVIAAVRASIPEFLQDQLQDSDIIIKPDAVSRTAGMDPANYRWATVTVTYDYHAITPMIGHALGNSGIATIYRKANQRMRLNCTITSSGSQSPCT
jgi:hypothetical protein